MFAMFAMTLRVCNVYSPCGKGHVVEMPGKKTMNTKDLTFSSAMLAKRMHT